jgi:TolB-like protein
MKKVLLVSCLLFLAALPAAALVRLALLDFTVESANPEYAQIGKGLAELVAFELRKSPSVALVEREKRRKLLAAGELSTPDMQDSKVRVRVGKMLGVNYLVLGEVVDGGEGVTLRLRLFSAAWGMLSWQGEVTESPALYEYASAFLALSLLEYLGARIPESTRQNATFRIRRHTEALLAFSAAVDCLDRGNRPGAREALARAAGVDPDAEGINAGLQRLQWPPEAVSPRFRIEPELCSPVYNAAALPFLQEDRFYYVYMVYALFDLLTAVDGYSVAEDNFVNVMGYLRPVGERLGLAVEILPHGGGYGRHLVTPFGFDYQGSPVNEIGGDPRFSGGGLSLGYALREDLGLGASLRCWYTGAESEDDYYYMVDMVDSGVNYAFQAGWLLRALEQRLVVEFSATYTDLAERYLDLDLGEVREGALPLLLEGSLAAPFWGRRLIASLRGVGEVFIDGRGGGVLRAVPVLEYRPLAWLYLRFGGEYARLRQAGEAASGWGVLSGASFFLGRLQLDANYSVRERPLRLLPGYTESVQTLLVQASLGPLFQGPKRSRVR